MAAIAPNMLPLRKEHIQNDKRLTFIASTTTEAIRRLFMFETRDNVEAERCWLSI